jgi:hypothetical protein
MTRPKYILKHEDGRSELIQDLDNMSRLILVDQVGAGAEDVTPICLTEPALKSAGDKVVGDRG